MYRSLLSLNTPLMGLAQRMYVPIIHTSARPGKAKVGRGARVVQRGGRCFRPRANGPLTSHPSVLVVCWSRLPPPPRCVLDRNPSLFVGCDRTDISINMGIVIGYLVAFGVAETVDGDGTCACVVSCVGWSLLSPVRDLRVLCRTV